MSLLPSSRPDIEESQEGAIEIRNLVDDDADDVFEALTAGTARQLLQPIHAEPGTPSELAERVDTTIQNASYHLDKLQSAELIRVAGTQYSTRGNEMKIYAPGENPIVFFVGQGSRTSSLFQLLKQAVGAISIVSGVTLFVHMALTDSVPYLDYAGSSGTSTIQGYLLAAFLGGLFSVLLYSIGRVLVRRPHRRHTAVLPNTVLRSSHGDSGMSKEKAMVIGSWFFTLSLLFWFVRQALGLTQTLYLYDILPWVICVPVLVTIAVAYRRSDLTICWFVSGLGFAGFLGHELALLPQGYANPKFAIWVGLIIAGSVVGGIMFGTVGFALGRLLRYGRSFLPIGSRETSSPD